MSDQLIPLNILIGDRTYRIKSLPTDEQHIRQTLKIINEKIIEFKTQFAGKDMQDYIAMVLIWYATDVTSNTNNLDDVAVSEMLNKIEQQVDKCLG
ncbi:MAG: cell division protein ZapA [Ginsengibacter sp.]